MRMNDEIYFALEGLRYSKLSKLDREGPRSIIANEDISTVPQVLIGSIVDDMLTNQLELQHKYMVVDIKKPTAMLGQLTDEVLTKFKKREDMTVQEILKLAKKMKLWKSIVKEEKYIEKFNNRNFWDYLDFSLASKGKILVDQEMWNLCEQMTQTLRTDEDTAAVFTEQPHLEIKMQEVMIWDNPEASVMDAPLYEKTYVCKFDVLHLNHVEQTIQFIDIKTMGVPVADFDKSFYRFRYYIQDALYQEGLKALRDKEYPGYTLKEPYNVIISSQEPEKAYKVNIDSNWLIAGKHGYTDHGRRKKGFLQLAKEYVWHLKNSQYDYTVEEYQNGRTKSIEFKGEL